MNKREVFIDCDPGQDDALAILLAARHLDIVGVGSVTGNTTVTNTTRNAQRLLDLVECDAPVYRGAATALLGDVVTAVEVHGASGLDGVDLPEPSRAVARQSAAQALVDLDPEIPIVAIGPLTNLALALALDDDFAGRSGGVYVMGGSASGGNVTPVAEFNIYADPEAAARVFASPLTLTLCALDVTRQFQSDAAMLDALRDVRAPIAAAATQVLEFLHRRMVQLTGRRNSAMHDPCAVLALTHPELFVFESRSVRVETVGHLTRGMTVIDQRPRAPDGEVRVATSIDARAARQLLLDALGAG